MDDIGAIFMASNITTTCCAKHVDIRYKYVNEFVEDEVVKIVFMKSADDNGDILTKTLSSDLHEKHTKKIVVEKP